MEESPEINKIGNQISLDQIEGYSMLTMAWSYVKREMESITRAVDCLSLYPAMTLVCCGFERPCN